MKKEILLASVSAFALMMAVPAAQSWANGNTQGAQALINNGQDPVPGNGNGGNGGPPNGGPPFGPPQETTVIDNEAEDNGNTRTNTITGSHTGASGIAHAQQNNGSNNSINAATAVQATMSTGGDIVTGAAVTGNTLENYTTHHGGTRTNEVLDSFNGFDGVATVQQNNGDHNEIGAATAVHVNNGGGADVEQFAVTNGMTADQTGDSGVHGGLWDDDSIRTNTINPSFNNASGVLSVQQNNGNANAIAIATAVAADTGSGTINQVAATNGTASNLAVSDGGLDRDNLIDSSFSSSSGIMNAQQNNGDANIMGVSNAVAANRGPGLGDPLNNDVEQVARTIGTVEDANTFDYDQNHPDGMRENTVTSSFNGSSGITSAQQNNGSSNVMGIANAVQANLNNEQNLSLNGDDNVDQVALTVGGTVNGSATEVGGPLTPTGAGSALNHRLNTITGSFQGYDGIASVQQNNGDNNVMGVGNTVVANKNTGDKTDDVESRAVTRGTVEDNSAFETSGANRDNLVDGSFNGSSGLATVQQNNGSNNVMGAANAVVANLNNQSDPAAGEVLNIARGVGSTLGNYAEDHTNTDRVNTIQNGSFNDFSGINTTQQNNGDNNVMGGSVSVVADDNAPARAGFGPATTLAALGSVVSGNTAIVNGTSVAPGYSNTISASYVGASGVMVSQQNNGSNNVIGSSIAVVANY